MQLWVWWPAIAGYYPMFSAIKTLAESHKYPNKIVHRSYKSKYFIITKKLSIELARSAEFLSRFYFVIFDTQTRINGKADSLTHWVNNSVAYHSNDQQQYF